MNKNPYGVDAQSETFLSALLQQEKTLANRVPGVRTVLVVLSSNGMFFDMESLKQKVLLAYPEAAVFFRTTSGKAVGVATPSRVDLLIDFTGPGSRQGLFYARKLRSLARLAVGRNAGLFRKKIYDRTVEEKGVALAQLPKDSLDRERMLQRQVLELAGVVMVAMGDLPADRSQSIALELPAMKRL